MALPTSKFKDEDGNEKKFTPPKKGKHNARLKVIADIGTQEPNDPKFSPQRRMIWLWELPDLSTKKEPRYVIQTLPFNGKSKQLKALLNRWLDYTEIDVRNMNIADILEEPAELNLVHSVDGKYANVAKENGVSKAKGRVKPGIMQPLCVTLIDGEYNEADFKKLPNWIQDKAMNSEEFLEVSGVQLKGKGKTKEKLKAKKSRK
jgi:hypothetical protein